MTKSTVPIESGSKRYLVNITPVHKSDSEFFSFYKLSNGLFLETHASSKSAEKYAKKMMKHYGYPEDSISAEWKWMIDGGSEKMINNNIKEVEV